MTDDSEKFVREVRRVLDEENQNLSGSTLNRLQRASNQALHSSNNKKAKIWGWSLAPIAGLILVAFLLRQPANFDQHKLDNISDWQIITSEESLEFFQEDIAFYEWVSEAMDNDSVHHRRNSSGVSSPFGFAKSGQRDANSGRITKEETTTQWRTPRVPRLI